MKVNSCEKVLSFKIVVSWQFLDFFENQFQLSIGKIICLKFMSHSLPEKLRIADRCASNTGCSDHIRNKNLKNYQHFWCVV